MYDHRGDDGTSRRIIDVAIGVLIGLRGCSQRDAFNELVDAVHDTGIGPAGLSGALVGLASGADVPGPSHDAVIHRWGHLLPESAKTRS